jgi:3-methylfumaryl-CoA hydratase
LSSLKLPILHRITILVFWRNEGFIDSILSRLVARAPIRADSPCAPLRDRMRLMTHPDAPPLDLEHLRQWIGRSETQTDIVTPRIVDSLRATLEGFGDDAPMPSLHWCLAPVLPAMSALGEDGHAARGGFLPPVPLPRRMWAAGELVLHRPLKAGDQVRRTSHVADVALKQGRTGQLCFVTVDHRITVKDTIAVEERQHLVYREAPGLGAPAVPPSKSPHAAQWTREIDVTAALLFRYSALIFNAHRIHYDRDWCRAEGYSGIVVHGPLQAALLLHFATSLLARTPQRFDFRATDALMDDQGLILNAARDADGMALWVTDRTGRVTMQANAKR